MRMLFFALLFMLIGASLAWAAAPLLVCYVSSNACVNVSIATPLPASSN